MVKIETERLVIREFAPEDAAGLHVIFGDSETMKNCEPAYDFEKTQAFLKDFCIGKKGALAVAMKDTGRLIGYLLCKPLGEDENEDVYEIGWIFNRTYWRQGLAFEACSALRGYAFEALHAHKLTAEAIDPVKSVGLMEKLGMVREGVQRSHTGDNRGGWADLYLYGMLREDWEHVKLTERKEHDYARKETEI